MHRLCSSLLSLIALSTLEYTNLFTSPLPYHYKAKFSFSSFALRVNPGIILKTLFTVTNPHPHYWALNRKTE